MSTTRPLVFRSARCQTACAMIALAVAVGLTWSFVASTNLIRGPGADAIATATGADSALSATVGLTSG